MDNSETIRGENGYIQLKLTYSKLYEKTNYTTTENIIIDRIYEYDISMANVSVLKRSGKFDEERLEYLSRLPKMEREVTIGKLIREDRNIQTAIKKGIHLARWNLFKENQIKDTEVISIKNDAVFVRGRVLKVIKFGPVEFKRKHQYAMFMKMDRMEFYYDRKRNIVDIKGINDTVLKEPDHQNGILQFISTVMEYIVMDRKTQLHEYLFQFIHTYKARELPYPYYRELSQDNCYRSQFSLSGNSVQLLQISQDDVSDLNISYNYNRFILPIAQRFL